MRASWDFALAGVALAWRGTRDRIEAARVVLSGVAPIPWRAAEAEKAIVGQTLDAAVAAAAGAAAVKGASPLSDNGYKVPLARGVVEETLTTLAV